VTDKRMPVLFVGHGSPMNAIEDNAFSRGWSALGRSLPLPKAILAVSAHWSVGGTFVTADPQPRTIHDFGGFPEELYQIEYPAPGDKGIAERVVALLGLDSSALHTDWGLDHGTWSVLKWAYPQADVPVVQLSIDARLEVREHLELAGQLLRLRDEGVLVFGSGNITHNLRDAFRRMHTGDASVPDWSDRFDESVMRCLVERDTPGLLGLWPGTEDGRRCHPSPDHWLPLIYVYAAMSREDTVAFPVEGFDIGLSMRSVLFSPLLLTVGSESADSTQ
jgi:4,5-DOPA dioxygenase extradiol